MKEKIAREDDLPEDQVTLELENAALLLSVVDRILQGVTPAILPSCEPLEMGQIAVYHVRMAMTTIQRGSLWGEPPVRPFRLPTRHLLGSGDLVSEIRGGVRKAGPYRCLAAILRTASGSRLWRSD